MSACAILHLYLCAEHKGFFIVSARESIARACPATSDFVLHNNFSLRWSRWAGIKITSRRKNWRSTKRLGSFCYHLTMTPYYLSQLSKLHFFFHLSLIDFHLQCRAFVALRQESYVYRFNSFHMKSENICFEILGKVKVKIPIMSHACASLCAVSFPKKYEKRNYQ